MRANENDLAWSHRSSNSATPRIPAGNKPVAASPRTRAGVSSASKAGLRPERTSSSNLGHEASDVLVQTGSVVKLLREVSEDELRGELQRRQLGSTVGSLDGGEAEEDDEADPEAGVNNAAQTGIDVEESKDGEQDGVDQEGDAEERESEGPVVLTTHDRGQAGEIQGVDEGGNIAGSGISTDADADARDEADTKLGSGLPAPEETAALHQVAAVIQGAWRARAARQARAVLHLRREQLAEQEAMIEVMNDLSRVNEAQQQPSLPQAPLSSARRKSLAGNARASPTSSRRPSLLDSPKGALVSPRGAVSRTSPHTALKKAGGVTRIPRTSLSPAAVRGREDYHSRQKALLRESDDDEESLELEAADCTQTAPLGDREKAGQGSTAASTMRPAQDDKRRGSGDDRDRRSAVDSDRCEIACEFRHETQLTLLLYTPPVYTGWAFCMRAICLYSH